MEKVKLTNLLMLTKRRGDECRSTLAAARDAICFDVRAQISAKFKSTKMFDASENPLIRE